jgi:hypothetical protein
MSLLQKNNVVEFIKKASIIVRENLEIVGSCATYLWPENGKYDFWKGYSYEIPKEEQIRSAFCSAMQSTGEVICELEWNIYNPGPRSIRVSGEIDIVCYQRNSFIRIPLILLEVKRLWYIKDWQNKHSEMTYMIQQDINKIKPVYDNIRKIAPKNAQEILAGVIIVGFSDSATNLEKLAADSFTKTSGIAQPIALWLDNFNKPCFEYEYDHDKTIPIYTRADLIILD